MPLLTHGFCVLLGILLGAVLESNLMKQKIREGAAGTFDEIDPEFADYVDRFIETRQKRQ